MTISTQIVCKMTIFTKKNYKMIIFTKKMTIFIKTRPSSDSEAATKDKLKGQSFNMAGSIPGLVSFPNCFHHASSEAEVYLVSLLGY